MSTNFIEGKYCGSSNIAKKRNSNDYTNSVQLCNGQWKPFNSPFLCLQGLSFSTKGKANLFSSVAQEGLMTKFHFVGRRVLGSSLECHNFDRCLC